MSDDNWEREAFLEKQRYIKLLELENEKLKDLVVDAWWADRSMDAGSNNKRWQEWSAQHPILQHNY